MQCNAILYVLFLHHCLSHAARIFTTAVEIQDLLSTYVNQVKVSHVLKVICPYKTVELTNSIAEFCYTIICQIGQISSPMR